MRFNERHFWLACLYVAGYILEMKYTSSVTRHWEFRQGSTLRENGSTPSPGLGTLNLPSQVPGLQSLRKTIVVIKNLIISEAMTKHIFKKKDKITAKNIFKLLFCIGQIRCLFPK